MSYMAPIVAERMAMMDPSLPPEQRELIVGQIRSMVGGDSITPADLRRAGFAAAAGWLTAKLLGFGAVPQALLAAYGAGTSLSPGVELGPYGAYGVTLPH